MVSNHESCNREVYLAERVFIYSLDRKAVYEAARISVPLGIDILLKSRSDQSGVSSSCSMKVQLNFRKLSRKPHNLYARVKCMNRENSSKVLIK